MAQATHLSSHGLHWVKQELGNSLRRVRDFIESYLETPANPLPLQRAVVELHQIHGTLRMVQCDGAAVLADEMKGAVQDLLRELDSAPEKAFEALLGSTLQLSDYLDLVAEGESDNALIFLPIINELRVSRGAGVVSESALFVHYASLQARKPPDSDVAGRAENAGQAVAVRRLSSFQAALLRVLKDQNTDENLQRLASITGELANAVSNARGQQLFTAAGAMLAAMQAGDLDADLEVKRLLGRVGQQIKNAADRADVALADAPDALVYGLVYFAGRTASDNPRITALRADYALSDLLPERNRLEALRARLRGPATGLVEKLSAEIRDDIAKVKDSIDLVIRAGDKAGINLKDTAAMTAGIADTLGMLGLDMLKRVVDNQAQAIASLAQSSVRDQDAWMDVALALLRVEQTLESALFQHMHRGFKNDESGPAEPTEPREDIDSGTRAIYREALVNTSRLKTLVPEYIGHGQPGTLAEAGRLLHEMESGLQIVEQREGAGLISRLREFVGSRAMPASRQNNVTVQLLADVIASIEYYLETLLTGYQQQPELLRQTVATLEKLEAEPGVEQPLAEADGPLHEDSQSDAEPASDSIDPDIRDIFLEEANEVLAVLQRDVPAWKNDLGEHGRLTGIRRAFHTLKGSGRMVGASEIGEFGWSVEYLLNRCMEQTIPTNTPVVEVVDKAVALLPQLIEDFRADRGSSQVAEVIALADKTSGRISEPAEQPSPEQDTQELMRVFRTDARAHVQAIKAFSEQPAPQPVSSNLVRALHTLKGSARAVELQSLSDVAAELEQFADISRVARQPIDGFGRDALLRAVSLFSARIEATDAGAQARADEGLQALLSDVAGLRARLPASALEDSSDQELLIVFTDEACDLLDDIDEGLADWRNAPVDMHHPTQIKAVCHKLKGSARTSDAQAIATVVEALETQVRDYLRSAQTPQPAEFQMLREVVDGLYDMLDRFRHGDRSDDPQTLLSLLGMEPEAADSAASPPGSDGQAVAVPEQDDDSGHDPELTRIFIAEATDIAEQVDTQIAAWTQNPEDEQPRLALMRLLHTIKGSARMAGANVIGDLAHDLESHVAAAHTASRRSEVSLLETLSRQADALHYRVDEVRASQADVPEALPQSEERAEDKTERAVQASQPLVTEFDACLYWQSSHEGDEPVTTQDTARVPVEQLDAMLNQAGEISIYRARLEQKTANFQFQLGELVQTTGRLREQLRKLDMETEAQILARHDAPAKSYNEEFDPLEMDRYSALHELSRGLAESVTDLTSLHGSMSELVSEDEVLLTQQARVNTTLQQGLMRTLMVPFSNQQARLQRLLRQASEEHERRVRIEFSGGEAELDRNVLERMTAPLEHLLRNAVIHGIETPRQRAEAGKDEVGVVAIGLRREGTQLIVSVHDDGRGLDYAGIRDTAVRRGLLRESAQVNNSDLALFIFEPGFSTAGKLTQSAGRGVGLDVVNAQIKQLGGAMTVDSQAGAGTRFNIRLPLTLAITQALMVRVGEEIYAVPIASVEGVARVERSAVPEHMASADPSFNYGGDLFHMLSLGQVLGGEAFPAAADEDATRNLPLLLVRSGERRTAFVVDAMLGSREIVAKPVGPQVSTVPGVSGATIRADGDVVLILDVAALLQLQARQVLGTQQTADAAVEVSDDRPLVMVVDDSITIRRVSERFLSRNGMRVVTARDGMDALAKLQANRPDVVLLDIEMPRIDGFELATYIRNSEDLKHTPIIMITSRSGDKHRRRAEQIGVDCFLTKPYQEQALLQQMYAVMRTRPRTTGDTDS